MANILPLNFKLDAGEQVQVMANILPLLLQLFLLLMNDGAAVDARKHSHSHSSTPSFAKVSHRSQIKRSFSFPPGAFGDRTGDIRLVGNAAVMDDGSVRIPALDSPLNQAGRALFASPVRMWDPKTSVPASFETSFSFVFSRSSKNASHESGGGLAFIIAPDEITVGREGPYLGMLNDACVHHRREKRLQHPVIAVEFDTFKDAEFGDPNDNHVGLNLGSLVSDQTADLSRAGVFLKNSSLVTAKISYDGSSQHLQVRVIPESQPGELNDDEIPPLISSPVDLSSFLREYMFVGFSASTGAEPLIHTIVSWNFSCESHAVQRYPSSPSWVSAPGGNFTGKSQLSHMECEDDIVEDKFDRPSSQKGTHPPPAFFVFISVSATVLFIILNVLLFCRRSRIHHHQICTGSSSGNNNQWSSPLVLLPRPRPLHKPREFDMKELLIATGEFNEKQKLGEGPSGAVYRGNLQDGSLVAIKRWNPSTWTSSSSSSAGTRYLCLPGGGSRCLCLPGRGRKQKQLLVSEILPALSRMKHPNLVPVRGWCCTGSELIIIYDYMPNASLDKWLHPGEALLTLPWIHRWKLARDVAAALQQLHSSRFVHGRLKSSNILLDITFQARVGDFGLTVSSSGSRGSTPDDSYHFPPEEQQQQQQWTPKMDVFGFGVICLELVTGGPPDAGLADRAWLLHEESKGFEELLDSRLERGVNWDQAMLLCGLGLLCTHPDPNSRPSMELVLGVLELRTELSPIPSRSSLDSRV